MNSPNLLAAAASQRTKRLKLLIYGNLLPLHDPLRLAEELAMLDCMSNGRLISGLRAWHPARVQRLQGAADRVARPLRGGVGDHPPRLDRGGVLLRGAVLVATRTWRSGRGRCSSRTRRSGCPVSGSKETIEWAGRNNIPITPGAGPTRGLREDIIRYYARCLTQHGHQLTPDHLIIQANVYIADSKAQAVKEAGPYTLYFNQTLFSHGNVTEAQPAAGGRLPELVARSTTCARRTWRASPGEREHFRDMTMADVEREAETMPWGTADEVIERIIADADHAGANTVLVSMNRGAMPHEMFMEQVRRFGAEVLPALQAHQVKTSPFA